MQLIRTRGDNYPITAFLKINGVATDLTGATVTFSYLKNGGGNTVNIINGVIVTALSGEVRFDPTLTDFVVTGEYNFEITAVKGGVRVTYLSGELILTEDISA